MNSLPYFPLSITRTHPLASPSLLTQRGGGFCNSIVTPFFATAEKGEGGRGDEYMQPEKMVNCTMHYNLCNFDQTINYK